MTTPISATGYYLDYTQGTSNKFYASVVAERFAITCWGRIGTAGQLSVQRMPGIGDAEAIVRRQAYAKAAKGYVMKTESLKFTTDFDLLATDARVALGDFEAAREASAYSATADVLARAYDEFNHVLEDVMTRLSAGDMEKMLAERDDLNSAWARVADAHELARAQVLAVSDRMINLVLENGAEV